MTLGYVRLKPCLIYFPDSNNSKMESVRVGIVFFAQRIMVRHYITLHKLTSHRFCRCFPIVTTATTEACNCSCFPYVMQPFLSFCDLYVSQCFCICPGNANAYSPGREFSFFLSKEVSFIRVPFWSTLKPLPASFCCFCQRNLFSLSYIRVNRQQI